MADPQQTDPYAATAGQDPYAATANQQDPYAATAGEDQGQTGGAQAPAQIYPPGVLGPQTIQNLAEAGRGGWKELQRQVGNAIDTITKAYTGEAPGTAPPTTAAQAIQRTLPGIVAPGAQMARALLPESVKAPIRKASQATADYLRKNTELETTPEKVGAIGTNVAELYAAPEAPVDEALAFLGEHFGQVSKVIQAARKPGLAGAGARVTLRSIFGAGKNAALAGGQEYLSSGDPDRAAKAAGLGATIGAVLDPIAGEATKYVSDLRSGTTSRSSGLIDRLLPPMEEPVRPVRPKPLPPPSRPAPLPALPERPVPPTAPELESVPRAPARPGPIEPAERPEMPIRPAAIPRPAPVEPTPVPEPPTFTPAEIPERAPAAERAAAMEAQAAQGTVADKYAQEAQTRAGEIGDPDTAAQHLQSLTSTIEDPNFINLPEDRQAQLLKDQEELLQRAQPAADPRTSENVLDQIGTFGAARDELRRRATAAYQDWGAKTKGLFTTLNDRLTVLRGRFDADSLKESAEIEAKLQKMYEDSGRTIASPIDRAVYRSQFANSYVLDDADKVFQNAYQGAARTGEFDEKALQRNWKSFVNKNGVAKVKSVIGDERYETMNAFVNDLAGESAADKAAQNAATADFEARMKVHKQTIQNARTLDEARQAALDAKHEAADFAQKQAYEDARIKAQQGINQARQTDRLERARRARQYADQYSQWQEEVLKTDNLNDAKKAAFKSERNTYKQQQAAFRRAEVERGNIGRAQKQQYALDKAKVDDYNQAVADAHNEAMGDYRFDLDRYQKQQQRRKQLMDLGKYGWGALGGGAGLEFASLYPGAPDWMKKPARAVGTALVLSSIMMNPRIASVAGTMARTGAKPEVYWPVIHSMLQEQYGKKPTPPEEEEQPQ